MKFKTRSKFGLCWVIFFLSSYACNASRALEDFAQKFWTWRSITAPISTDDLPRTALDRPLLWSPNCSSEAFRKHSLDYESLVHELLEIRRETQFGQWSRDDQSDYWALTSALNRVYWEQRILRAPWRDSGFAHGTSRNCRPLP